MGQLEQKSRKKKQRKDLQSIILQTVAMTGVMSAALIAPNVIGAMAKLGLFPNKRQKEYIASSASRLAKRGLLKYDGSCYRLTSVGRSKLIHWRFNNFKLHRPKRWDGRWRIVIFDIPEKKRKIRDQIRYLFKQAGLVGLQDSVWVYPYDCEDILTLLKTDLGVGKQVLYLIVDELENDRHLRGEFDLI